MEEIYERYWATLVADAFCRLRDMGLAEDCAQETFMILVRKLDLGASIPDEKMLRAFLFRTNRNVALHMARQRNRERNVVASIEDEGDNVIEDESDYYALENQEILDNALDSMTMRNAILAVWHYGYNATYSQMAENLGENTGNVRRATERAMKDLQDKMREDMK